MNEQKEKIIIRNVFEKTVEGIKFVGTIAMVFMLGFVVLSLLSEMWLPILIAFPFVYIIYKWLGIVLTGILFFAIVLLDIIFRFQLF